MTRSEEIRAIDAYITTHGVRWCEPRYAVTTDAFVPLHVATARIAAIDTRSDPFAYARLLHRLAMAWSR